MSGDRAKRLASTRAPSTYAGRGPAEVRNRLRHEVASRKFVRRDPGARRLQHEVDIWSGYRGPSYARQGKLKVLRAHVQAAGVAPVPLYRGMALSTTPKRGERIVMPISSFTSDRRVAERFANHRVKQAGGKPVVMQVRGARALHVSPLARRRGIGMQEWVGQGTFKVTRGGSMPRLVAVNKAMPNVLSVPRPIGTLRRPTYRDSTLVHRRSASGSLVQTRRRASLG